MADETRLRGAAAPGQQAVADAGCLRGSGSTPAPSAWRATRRARPPCVDEPPFSAATASRKRAKAPSGAPGPRPGSPRAGRSRRSCLQEPGARAEPVKTAGQAPVAQRALAGRRSPCSSRVSGKSRKRRGPAGQEVRAAAAQLAGARAGEEEARCGRRSGAAPRRAGPARVWISSTKTTASPRAAAPRPPDGSATAPSQRAEKCPASAGQPTTSAAAAVSHQCALARLPGAKQQHGPGGQPAEPLQHAAKV